jgi:ATP-dependent helicase/nuclease subunit A
MTPTDADARARLSTDLDTTFFVEAGAGTGKTRELVARVVALVASGRLSMPGLAAITFTEKAAAELRDRIRRELAVAAVDELVWTADERRRCLEASRSVDVAHIETIHAFAGDLLRTFPLEAQLPPGFEIWDEMQRDHDFDERFRAWLYDEVPAAGNELRRDAVARVLALGLQPERLKLLVQRLQEHYDVLRPDSVWEPGDPPDPVSLANELGDVLLELDSVLGHAQLGEADALVSEVRSLAFTAERLAMATDKASAFEALLRYLLKRPNANRGRQSDWNPHPTLGNPVSFIRETLGSTSERISTAIEAHRTAALANLLGYVSEFTLAYARDRQNRGVATFHDLLVWARDLLRDHPRVRQAAQARIERLFVDEFQDTDPLQAELIAYLAGDPDLATERDWTILLDHLVPGKLFVVGDPKQSIYRFRRAEVAVYQHVYQASPQPGAASASLVQTFRAVDPLVDWVNAHFSAEMRAEPEVQSAYAALEARSPLPDVDLDMTACGVRTVGGADDRKAGERWLLEADSIARLARKAVLEQWPVTEQVDGAWQVRPACFKDICVLLPTRTNLRRLERAFEQNDVPYRMESGSLVVFTQEVRDIVACLRAIEDPSDQVALVAALKSPAYACSDVDLLRWVEEGGQLNYLSPGRAVDVTLDGSVGQSVGGPVGAAFVSLRGFHTCRTERSAAATVEALIRGRSLGLLALDHPRPREALRRQRYVVAQARKLASAGDPTLRGFVHWIETLRKNELYDAESAVPDSDENAVRLMTIHGSKGLEFPIVILSGLGGGARPNDGVQLLADHHQGTLEARCTVRAGSGPAFHTFGFDAAREKRLLEAEQLRLLYVAATRAREHLVLCLFHSTKYGKLSHAAAICNRLQTLTHARPTEIPLADLQSLPFAEPTPASSAAASPVHAIARSRLARSLPLPLGEGGGEGALRATSHVLDSAPAEHAKAQETSPEAHAYDEATSPASHARAEAAWLAHRRTLLHELGQLRLATPSGLAHEPEPPEFATASAADQFVPPTARNPRGGTALGLAVHATLQWLDLESLSNLDTLATFFAVQHEVDPTEVAHLARLAAESVPVRQAVTSGRYWREVPISADIDGVLLEGTIDLLYEDATASLVVVDYKTDRVSPITLIARAEHYRLQAAAYALGLQRATGQAITRIEFVFAAASPNHAEVLTIPTPDLSAIQVAITQFAG